MSNVLSPADGRRAPSEAGAVGPARLVAWTILIGTGVRVWFAAVLGHGYGESYYVASVRNLALSYFDQPPLSLWITWAAVQVAGPDSLLGTRFPFIAMFAVTTWLMYRLGARLFGEWAGAWAALLLNLSFVFTVSVSSWVQPEGPLFLFLLAAALAVTKLCFDPPSRTATTWAIAGVCFGLALLSKYHAVLVLAGLLLFVATTPGYRAWFFSPGLVLAGLIAVAIFAPVIIWNAENDWVSFVFHGERAAGTELHFEWLLRSIGGQALLVGLLLWPPLIYCFFKALRIGRRDPKSWFLCCLAILPIGVFTVIALWAPLGYHFHWQAPGYLFLFPILGKVVAERMGAGSRLTKAWLAILVASLLVITVAAGAQASRGWIYRILPESFRALPYYETNPLREMLVWHELRGALVAEGLIPQERLFVVSPNWYQAGKADIEIGDDLPVVCFSSDPRNIAFVWDDRQFLGWDALIIATSETSFDAAAVYGDYFREIVPLKDIDVHLGGEVAVTIHVFRARDYYRPYPLPLPPSRVAPSTGAPVSP